MDHSDAELISSTECTSCQNFTDFMETDANKRIVNMILPLTLDLCAIGSLFQRRRSFKNSDENLEKDGRRRTFSDEESASSQSTTPVVRRKFASQKVGEDSSPVVRRKSLDCDSYSLVSDDELTGSGSPGNSTGPPEQADTKADITEEDPVFYATLPQKNNNTIPEIIVSDASETSTCMREADCDISKDSGISDANSSVSITNVSSSLSEEEQQWLGKRGVRLSTG